VAVLSDRLYETDFYQWTQDTAAKLRERRFDELDVDAVAEEIEDLGKRDEREVNSRLRVIIMHLLKLQYQSEKRTDSWTDTIGRERTELEGLFEGNESLKTKALERLPRTYMQAVRDAARETRLPSRTFPSECPYIYEQILDHDFYPA
jgi:hypothetical protein